MVGELGDSTQIQESEHPNIVMSSSTSNRTVLTESGEGPTVGSDVVGAGVVGAGVVGAGVVLSEMKKRWKVA